MKKIKNIYFLKILDFFVCVFKYTFLKKFRFSNFHQELYLKLKVKPKKY